MKTRTKLVPVLFAAVLAFASGHLAAVDSDPSPKPKPSEPKSDYDAGRQAIEARDWNGAIKSLSSAAQRDSRNPDIQNLLGYAYRNSGQLDIAFKYYERALQLDPRHLGAHEYIGEAYLMANNPAK